MPDFLRDVSLDSLVLLAAQALARREVFLLESEHIAAKPIPVEVHVRAIHQRIKNLGHLRFSQLVTPETPETAGGGHVFGGAGAVQALHGNRSAV